MTSTRKKIVTIFVVTLIFTGLLGYAILTVSNPAQPGKAANKACIGHGGVDRFGSEPSGGDFTVICRDHVVVDVTY